MVMTRIVTRRRFLARSATLGVGTLGLAAVGGGGLLTGCGQVSRPPDVVGLYNPDRVLAAGQPQRIPFALIDPGDDEGVILPTDDGLVQVELVADGEVIDRIEVAGHVVIHDHVGDVGDHQHSDLYRYYPARVTMPTPGIYDLLITVAPSPGQYGNQPAATLAVQAFDPAQIAVPIPGEAMPAVATPTFDDPSGVDRLCTRPDPCPFHEVSLDSVAGRGQPTALLIATPAFCSTAYCGPVVETLIEAAALVPDVTVVHSEVYANPDEVNGNFADPAIRLAPTVEALGLTFEPTLFLISSNGTVIERIDNVFDVDEAVQALGQLT